MHWILGQRMQLIGRALAGGSIAAMCLLGLSVASALPSEGVNFSAVTRPDSLAARWLTERGEIITAAASATIAVNEFLPADLLQTVSYDFEIGANSFDVTVIGSGRRPKLTAARSFENLESNTCEDKLIWIMRRLGSSAYFGSLTGWSARSQSMVTASCCIVGQTHLKRTAWNRRSYG